MKYVSGYRGGVREMNVLAKMNYIIYFYFEVGIQ
jgi:hypothetical protein